MLILGKYRSEWLLVWKWLLVWNLQSGEDWALRDMILKRNIHLERLFVVLAVLQIERILEILNLLFMVLI